MPIYEFRCPADGPFEVYRPMGTAPDSIPCAACGKPAMRVMSLPVLRRGPHSAVIAAMDRAERSAHEPDVVSAPPRRDGMATRALKVTPELMRLPRR